MLVVSRIQHWYGRFERPISSISLIGGFVFDAFALKRIDLFWENFWVVAHLVVVALCIILINLQEHQDVDEKDPSKAHFWYINILQFFFGGLLSAFIIFYFRSTTLAVTWPFILILAVAFIANESLKKHYARLTFQISLFFLSLLSFAIFIVPIFFNRIGTDIFIMSGFISLAILLLFLLGLRFFAKEKFQKSKIMLAFSVTSIFLAIHILYFFNFIPPIPLSLKDAGIYHSLVRTAQGDYMVQSELTDWLDYVTLSQDIRVVAGNPVYAYSAIFSPASFNTEIIHEWQIYDSVSRRWATVSRIYLSATGGREEGYRTYSVKNNITPGTWRVNVETSRQQIIGRLRFDVITTVVEPPLITEIKL